MRRLITSIAEKTTTVLGRRCREIDVTGTVTPRLLAPSYARILWTWLAGEVPVGARVAVARHMRPAVAVRGAARVLRHHCLGTLRPRLRRMEPGCEASLKRF